MPNSFRYRRQVTHFGHSSNLFRSVQPLAIIEQGDVRSRSGLICNFAGMISLFDKIPLAVFTLIRVGIVGIRSDVLLQVPRIARPPAVPLGASLGIDPR